MSIMAIDGGSEVWEVMVQLVSKLVEKHFGVVGENSQRIARFISIMR